MKTLRNVITLAFLLISSFTTLNAQTISSYSIYTDPIYNDFYKCTMDNGDPIYLHYFHMRLTEVSIHAFNNFYFNKGTVMIVASAVLPREGHPTTLHIFHGEDRLPNSMDAHFPNGRAPIKYSLKCHITPPFTATTTLK